MLFKKSINRGNAARNSAFKMAILLPILSILTSCTTFIPGLDRVLFSNSSAKVGPLVTADEQYPTNDDEIATENETLVDAPAKPTEPASDPRPVEQTGKISDAAIDASEPTPSRPTPTKVKVAKSQPKEIKTEARKVKQDSAPQSDSAKLAASQGKPELAVEYGSVAGNVVLLGEAQKPLLAAGTMVTLTPKTMMDNRRDRPSQVHVIDMEDKEYQPRYSTIQSGDQVVFVNKDNIQHNVFSSSGNNAFDLGTYGAGLKRAVTLKEPGIVKVYCNIHSDMVTFVAVGDQGLSVQADDQGRYQMNKVLPGSYELAIWNIRGETKRIIDVKANQVTQLVDRIDTNAFKAEPHKNKFGGDYSNNSALFEDEFY